MPRYEIDPERSTVTIEASSTVHPIHSEARGIQGWVEVELGPDGALDLAAPARARLEFPVDRLRSGNPLEDRELKRRIDARRHPTIVGELESVEVVAGAPEPGTVGVVGGLTFMGHTKRYEHEMCWTFADDRTLRLQGAAEFDVRDFGMEPPKILLLKVHPEVDVRVDLYASIAE